MHAVIAMRRGPHWLLNDQDAKAYGTALANALRHLPVSMAQKYVDFASLGIAVLAYEGPRLGIDMQLRQQRQQQTRRPGPMGQVFQFNPARPPPAGAPGVAAAPSAPASGSGHPANSFVGTPSAAATENPAPAGPAPDMTYEPDFSA
jgi:hypothetical protein